MSFRERHQCLWTADNEMAPDENYSVATFAICKASRSLERRGSMERSDDRKKIDFSRRFVVQVIDGERFRMVWLF